MATIVILKTDITKLQVDAIVNAANTTLLGGGGVDGAIHRAAGTSVFNECWKIGRCRTGQAEITSAGNLPAKYIIHAVGPKYETGSRNELQLLDSAYTNSSALSAHHNVESIAFPPLGCGNYRFPIEKAAEIALTAVTREMPLLPQIKQVIFACLGDDTFEPFQHMLRRLIA